MIDILLSIALTIGGAILERETKGAFTINIGYADQNMSEECKP